MNVQVLSLPTFFAPAAPAKKVGRLPGRDPAGRQDGKLANERKEDGTPD
jgi:hypothetical protein